MINDMINIIQRYWRKDVFSQGGTEANGAAIEAAFVHAGFEHVQPRLAVDMVYPSLRGYSGRALVPPGPRRAPGPAGPRSRR